MIRLPFSDFSSRIFASFQTKPQLEALPVAEPSQMKMPPACSEGKVSGVSEGECRVAGRRIGYGVRVGFSAPDPKSGQRELGLFGWILDFDSFTPAGRLCITTQDDTQHYVAPSEPRGDIINSLGVPTEHRSKAVRCGFSGQIPNSGDRVTLAVELNGERHEIGAGLATPPKILSGSNGWLFLAGDNNDSPGQFTGTHSPSESWIEGWSRYFDALDSLRSSDIAGHALYVVAPAKETLFHDAYPLPRGAQTPLETLWKMFGDRPDMYDPTELLIPLRELAYDRAETHWTDFGARLVCEKLLELWQIRKPALPFNVSMEWATGDLGWKAVPPVRTYRPQAAWPNPSKVIFDNAIRHHGFVRITQNPKPLKPQSCVIFGGSSGVHMEKYLTAIFERVVYVYSAGAWDPELLAHERPDYTILQCAERFLTRPLAPEVNTRQVVASKLKRGEVTRSEPRADLLAQWTGPNLDFYKKMG